MKSFRCLVVMVCLIAGMVGWSDTGFGQKIDPSAYQGLRWRCIGPFRGGRTVGAAGIPGRPNVFYIGVNHGGVWKTTDAGRTWKPIFDSQPTGSIGDLAVAPSNPDIVYVGSGEGLQRPDLSVGDGMYKSTDGGKTWRHLGLRDAQQIGSIAVDPGDPNHVLVAVLGHPYGANVERGIFMTRDGGETWSKVLYKDENTGAIQVAFDPKDNRTVYGVLWAARQGPWENGAWQGPGSGLFKSTDGGMTWRPLSKGLPNFEQGLGRIGFACSPSTSGRMYAVVDSNPQTGGLYRSDDSGESWRLINQDSRLWGRGSDFAEVKVDPKNTDIVYVANIVTWRSIDGGNSFTAFKGAPGGDDYHRIWINPDNPGIILLASDQGAVVTVNGGETWSSWYNQATAQFYHVITDNRFPYWVYGGQQESGSAGVASRGDYGAITWRDWRTVGVEEYGYVAPDPLHPDHIYGGKITRFDWKTGHVQNIAPEAVRSGKYRFLRTAPVIFSPVDRKTLYFAGNVLFKTTTYGASWDVVSPDLSREKFEIPESIGVYRTPDMAAMPRRGVIYSVAPSNFSLNTIWVGTDDGLIHVTYDGGKSWKNVTPPELTPWSKVSLIVASKFDDQTAYVAVNRFRLDDLRPHIFRTHDGGKTWKRISNGIPDNEVVNAVREDPVRKGLLFAGTERAVHVSFDDGENWQSLRLNMPSTSIRDLVVHGDDIVVGTHGRSFWILDDISPLRQMDGKALDAAAFLFAPQPAYRVKRSVNTDTPIPPDEPMGQNPPDGAIINYWLKERAVGPVTIEIFNSAGNRVRRFSSEDPPEAVNEKELNIPTYWIRPSRRIAIERGMQRFVWDLRYPPPPGVPRTYPISAIFGDTPSEPLGPAVLPGTYSVTLTVNGHKETQSLVIRMDPRVTTSRSELARQFVLSNEVYEMIGKLDGIVRDARNLREATAAALSRSPSDEVAKRLKQFDTDLEGLVGRQPGRRGTGPDQSVGTVIADCVGLLDILQEADSPPTTQAVAAVGAARKNATSLVLKWESLKSVELREVNQILGRNNLPLIGETQLGNQ